MIICLLSFCHNNTYLKCTLHNIMININQLDSSLHSRLSSRRIPYETYLLSDGSAIIIVSVRTSKFSASIPYCIREHDDNVYVLMPELTVIKPTINAALSVIVSDVRSIEMKFSRWKK